MSDSSANGSNNIDDKNDVKDDSVNDDSTTGPSTSSSGLKRKHDVRILKSNETFNLQKSLKNCTW